MARIDVGKTRASFWRAAARINRAVRAMPRPVGQGLRMIGEEVMTDIKASRPGAGVPRRDGILASTGRVDGPVEGRRGPEVELSFGGAAAPYALAQHERLDYHHPVGEARYLVRGLERWQPDGSAAHEALAANVQAGLDAVGRGS
jgi:hypothetical protein